MRFRKVEVGYDGKPVKGPKDVELFDEQDMTDLVNGNQLGYNHFARNSHISLIRREKESSIKQVGFCYVGQVSSALDEMGDRFTPSQLIEATGVAA